MLEKARELGFALANSPEFLRMKRAQMLVENDEAINSLIDELRQKRAQLVDILGGDDVDGALALELSGDIERLQGQLQENPQFTELIESETAFNALITAIDNEINACIGVAKSGCGGGCDNCSGCRH